MKYINYLAKHKKYKVKYKSYKVYTRQKYLPSFITIPLLIIITALLLAAILVAMSPEDTRNRAVSTLKSFFNIRDSRDKETGPGGNGGGSGNGSDPGNQGSSDYITAKLAIAGDIVLHTPITDASYDRISGMYDYGYIFRYAEKYLKAADLSVACIETTFAGPAAGYTGYPLFRSPDSLAFNLKKAGISLLSTASNHSMDSYFSGLVRTLDVLGLYGISHVGTYRSAEERDFSNGIKVVKVNGITIAFLAYTYGTNGLSVTGHEFAANIFTVDYLTNLSIIDYDLLKADMAAARALGTDFIAVFMHWGSEYQTIPSPQQEELAEFLFAEGAGLILGGHVHVPQPMELRDEGFICYCLGNFISNQHDRYTNLTAIVNLELSKDRRTGETAITKASYVPMYMLHPDAANDGRYSLLDIREAMSEYESGDYTRVGDALYMKLKEALADSHRLFGASEIMK